MELKKTISYGGETFHKALITENAVYYMYEEEVVMFNKKGELISDNFFASQDMEKKMVTNDFTWISKDNRYNLKCIIEETYQEDFNQWFKINMLKINGGYTLKKIINGQVFKTKKEVFTHYMKNIIY
jgi:hypothetical protein